MKAEKTLGYKLGYMVGTIKELPRYIFWFCAWPFLIIAGTYCGARFGRKLYRLDQDLSAQRQDLN